MKLFKSLLYSFIVLIFISCDRSWHLSELYIQKIENSSKVIYKYDAWGGRDSHIFGYAILDSTDVFDIDNVKPLPFQYFENIPTKRNISGVICEKLDDKKASNKIFMPLEIKDNKEQGIKIKTKIFQNEGFVSRNQGYKRYQFETFKESKDSLFFYNLNDVESLEPEHLDVLKFKKTNIYIRTKSQNLISNISIEDLKLSPKNEIISNIRYDLTPQNKTDIRNFSNVGIFKEVKIRRKIE
ncbi:hypothetical protein [Flavobacterium reichenbachii]|uniref:Lipoprotein n=1 Tax=Flavobacterium reichenbachii TaxID=362418 RepID=A0A085ZII9_9FLAO|nr:hypothetical protein [Flavobacterium reichenbachii]KFF04253.1 hypothetical protein IW19_01360 [Flavobacterium reichenbachii]OXB13850.1 hypothetical protein B0A68_13955 [Flavobacterium reichenbachii]